MDAGTWLAVTTSDLAAGSMRAVQVGGASIAIYNIGGVFYATSNVCTHATAFLTEGWLEDGVIECPLHAGRFDVATGKGLGAPIPCDLKVYPCRVAGEDVEINVE
jgi:naphthalene 1,2-dioxygenase system ferredoxin subunit